MHAPIIEGPYLADVLAQPTALERTEQALDVPPLLTALSSRLAAGELERVVLTGMGSSFHSLKPLHLDLIGRGFNSIMAETSELLFGFAPLLRPRTLLVVVSQSGASVEVARLLGRLPQGLPVIGVTNTKGSPLAARANVVLFTQAGSESTVSCKTYLASLVALDWLSGILCAEEQRTVRTELQQAAPAVSRYLREWRSHVEILRTELEGVHNLFLVGRGASLAAAGVGGLIIKESAHVPAEGMSSGAFRHGPFEMLSARTFVGVFLGDSATAALNQRLCADVIRAGGRAALIGEGECHDAFRLPPGPERIRPILELLPVEMMSFALAALEGREAGRFELASKITTVE
jgi:glucosamine--fructose-6-phosphate aminotransferase (isomerizing)